MKIMNHKYFLKLITFSLLASFVIPLTPSAQAAEDNGLSAEELMLKIRDATNDDLEKMGYGVDFTGEDKFGDGITFQEQYWQKLNEVNDRVQTIKDVLENQNRLDINEHDRRLLRQYLEASILSPSDPNNPLFRADLKPYDVRVLKLLEKLALPEEKGGAGHEYLKVDRIRRNYELERQQISKETENAENISAHTNGQAVDITAIDQTRCVAKGLFRTKKLRKFPVKVEWQAETRPGQSGLPFGDDFNEISLNMAFSEVKDLFSSDPKIRASAWRSLFFEVGKARLEEEIDLEPGELDDTTEKTFFKDVGLALIGKKLGLPDFRALDGQNLEEISFKIALSYLEYDLEFPRGTMTSAFRPGMTWDGSWQEILTAAGKRRVEKDLGLNLGVLDEPEKHKDEIERAVTNRFDPNLYKDADLAFNLPPSSAQRIRNGDQTVYLTIGAAILADGLNYTDEEKRGFIANAENGVFANLNIGRRSFSLQLTTGEISKVFQGNPNEREAALRTAGSRLLDRVLQSELANFDEEVYNALVEEIGIRDRNAPGRLYFNDVRNIIVTQDRRERLVYNVAAKKMESQFDLPEHSMKYALLRDSRSRNPEDIARSLENNFLRDIGEAYIEEVLGLQENQLQFNDLSELRANGILSKFSSNPSYVDRQLGLSPGKTADLVRGGISFEEYKKETGQIILGTSIADNFADSLDLPQIGDYQIKPSDLIGFFTGDWEDALLKVGANFAEEEFDLPAGTIYSIASQEGQQTSEQIFLAAGGQRLASIFNMRTLDLQGINNTSDFTNSLGRQKIEQVFGIKPGSFIGSMENVKNKNFERIVVIQKMDVEQGTKGFDLLLDIPEGSTHNLIVGQLSIQQFTDLVGKRSVEIAGAIELWDRFGWAEEYKISGRELKSAIDQGNYGALLGVFENIAGWNLDDIFGFQKGTAAKIVRNWNNETERTALLIEEGAKKLGESLGLKEGDVNAFIRIYREGDRSEHDALIAAIQVATGIPPADLDHPERAEDLKSFLNGNIEDGIKYFAAAQFAKQWQEKGLLLTYEDVKAAIAFNDKDKQDLIAVSIVEYYLVKDSPWARYLPSGFLRRWMEAAKEENPDVAKSLQTNLLLEWVGNLAMAGKLGDAFQGINPEALIALNKYFNLPPEERKNPLVLNELARSGVFNAIDLNSEKWFGFKFQPGTGDALFKYAVTGDFGVFKNDLGNAYEDWGANKLGGWLDDQLGLKNGTAQNWYQDYNYIKGLDNQLDLGKISQTDFYVAIGARLFGDQLASLDQQWGLPPGFTQDVIIGLATGNPVYFYRAAYNLLFGVWKVKCPDLQKKARENVRDLLGDILAIGEKDPSLIPSQIMTYSEDDALYFSPQLDKLYPERRDPGTNYGMGVNPKMYDRVHIGY